VPNPEQLIRTAIAVPLAITRRVIGFGLGLLPGSGDEDRQYTEHEVRPSREHVATPVRVEVRAEAPGSPGPQVHVDEPWEGYRRMEVAEIVARLEGQSPEVLAAVELYETTHRHRGGVLNAVRGASRA
jgi:hypothetical protein